MILRRCGVHVFVSWEIDYMRLVPILRGNESAGAILWPKENDNFNHFGGMEHSTGVAICYNSSLFSKILTKKTNVTQNKHVFIVVICIE